MLMRTDPFRDPFRDCGLTACDQGMAAWAVGRAAPDLVSRRQW
jgi:hypothetical protein